MKEQDKTQSILNHIQDLAAEEHRLYAQGIASLPVMRLERKLGELPKDVLDRRKEALAFLFEMA